MTDRWFVGSDIDELMRGSYEALLASGETVVSTRGVSAELRGVQLELSNPRARVSRSLRRGRALSVVAEFAWYASGSDEVPPIAFYIPSYPSFVGSDVRAAGAYGPRLFGQGGQVEGIVTMLAASSSTRKAIVQLFDRDDLDAERLDVPCTCTLQFFVRGGRLELQVHMRSNDAWIGLPHDLFAFTMIQEWVAARLGLDLGPYLHFVGSYHLYERDRSAVNDYLGEGFFESRAMDPMPRLDPLADLAGLVDVEESIRTGRATAAEVESGYWGDLARVLWAQNPALESVGASNSGWPLRMSSSFFDVYLADLVDQRARRAERHTA